MWEVTDGVVLGERVIVQGGQRTREGSTVKVKDWIAPGQQIASGSPPAEKKP
jgi:hypothetical protein